MEFFLISESNAYFKKNLRLYLFMQEWYRTLRTWLFFEDVIECRELSPHLYFWFNKEELQSDFFFPINREMELYRAIVCIIEA